MHFFIYLTGRVIDSERQRQRERSSLHWFTPQMATMAGAVPMQSQEQGASLWSPIWVQGPSTWAILHCHSGMQQRAGLEEEQLGLEPSAHMECRHCSKWATALALEFYQIKKLLQSKQNNQHNKETIWNWRKYLENIHLLRCIHPLRHFKNSMKKWTDFKIGIRSKCSFVKERHTNGQEVHEKCSASLINREIQIQIKTTIRHQVTPVRMPIIKGKTVAGIVTQQVKPCSVTLASHMSTSSTPHPIQLPANVSGEAAEGDPSAWAPVIHMGDPDGVLGFWLQSGTELAIVVIFRVNQWWKICLSVSLCVSLFVTVPFK